jgi:hypothetical protein
MLNTLALHIDCFTLDAVVECNLSYKNTTRIFTMASMKKLFLTTVLAFSIFAPLCLQAMDQATIIDVLSNDNWREVKGSLSFEERIALSRVNKHLRSNFNNEVHHFDAFTIDMGSEEQKKRNKDICSLFASRCIKIANLQCILRRPDVFKADGCSLEELAEEGKLFAQEMKTFSDVFSGKQPTFSSVHAVFYGNWYFSDVANEIRFLIESLQTDSLYLEDDGNYPYASSFTGLSMLLGAANKASDLRTLKLQYSLADITFMQRKHLKKICKSGSLQVLDFSNTNCKSEMLEIIDLKSNTTLRALNLSNNRLDDIVGGRLMEHLIHNTALKTLDLRNNPDISNTCKEFLQNNKSISCKLLL